MVAEGESTKVIGDKVREAAQKISQTIDPSSFFGENDLFEALFIQCLDDQQILFLPQIIEYLSLSNYDPYCLMLLKFLYASHISLFGKKTSEEFDRDDETKKIIQNYENILQASSDAEILKAHMLCTYTLYNSILDKDAKAIEILTNYAEKNISKYQIWIVLCKIYEKKRNWQNAIYCLEELLLQQPTNPYIHLKLSLFLENLAESRPAGSADSNAAIGRNVKVDGCLKHLLFAYTSNRKQPILGDNDLRLLIIKIKSLMPNQQNDSSSQSVRKILNCCEEDFQRLQQKN